MTYNRISTNSYLYKENNYLRIVLDGDYIERIDVAKDILGSRKITDIQRRVLFEKYGFDGKGEKDFAEMEDNYSVGRCRIGQVAAKGLRNLRSDVKVRKYNKN